ncbi:hypothetical protein K490DRAFT_68833 [Saccharata proteae CBS 121410]|uniref:Uncharacterized protein n=1 Tax=Saccharata proteae CBS 121410 TaxID=1314787 RepID=A0A9P4HS87_9PEZI|nr:hypothetical protein K490DRAFT_68833 [Saccharata proteae CBS 121410]
MSSALWNTPITVSFALWNARTIQNHVRFRKMRIDYDNWVSLAALVERCRVEVTNLVLARRHELQDLEGPAPRINPISAGKMYYAEVTLSRAQEIFAEDFYQMDKDRIWMKNNDAHGIDWSTHRSRLTAMKRFGPTIIGLAEQVFDRNDLEVGIGRDSWHSGWTAYIKGTEGVNSISLIYKGPSGSFSTYYAIENLFRELVILCIPTAVQVRAVLNANSIDPPRPPSQQVIVAEMSELQNGSP